jgi:hypothetical protein
VVSQLIYEFLAIRGCLYGTLLRFWPVEELAGLADGLAGCGELARVGFSHAWNFSVTRSTVLTEADRMTRPGLASLLEGACPNCLQISKKFFPVPMRILKDKIMFWSHP